VRVRFLGVDFGQRRIGLALSDASGLLARPWMTLAAAGTPDGSARLVTEWLAGRRREGDEAVAELGGIVVGLPRRLGGTDTGQTGAARAFADGLSRESGMPVHLQDERLSSYEAEQLLAERERDWRKRKLKLDAAAAAVILQDYLDARARRVGSAESE